MDKEQHGETPPASSDAAASEQRTGSEEEYARQAEERFVDDLVARGEAVPEGEPLPPGATHVIVRDESGRRTLRRVRFSGRRAPAEEDPP